MESDKIKDHIYMKILKYAYEHETFTFKEITESLNISEEDLVKYGCEPKIVIHPFKETGGGIDLEKLIISYEGFINYLEYIELNEARESSKTAKELATKSLKRSTLAIIISAFLAIFSIGISIYQINKPTTVIMKPTQFETLLKKME